jgi:hypothetical protein
MPRRKRTFRETETTARSQSWARDPLRLDWRRRFGTLVPVPDDSPRRRIDYLVVQAEECQAPIVTSLSKTGATLSMTTQPDHILIARYRAPDSLLIFFEDGLNDIWSFSQLGINPVGLNWRTIQVTDSGTTLEVSDYRGRHFKLDSASIRSMVDPKYAARMIEALSAMEIPDDMLAELAATRPPANWQGHDTDVF